MATLDNSNISNPYVASRHFQLRSTDFGTNPNKVSLSVATGSGGQDYSLLLPKSAPTVGQALVKSSTPGLLEWQNVNSAGFFYRGITNTSGANDFYSDEEGNLISILKEVPLEPQDAGYTETNNGYKVQIKNVDCLYNMQCYKSAKDAEELPAAVGGVTLKPDGTALTTAYDVKAGTAYAYDSGTSEFYDVGIPLQYATGIFNGNLSDAATGEGIEYWPSVGANKTLAQEFGSTPAVDATLNRYSIAINEVGLKSVNAMKQFQDTLNFLTRRELNVSGKTPNDFSHTVIRPDKTVISGFVGADTTGAYRGVYELSAFTAAAGASGLTFKTGSAEAANTTLLSVDTTTAAMGTGANYKIQVTNGNFKYLENGGANEVVNASSASVLLDAVASNRSLALDATSFRVEDNAVDRVVVNSNDIVLQKTTATSKLELLGTAASESLAYTLDASTVLSSATPESILAIQKSGFKLGSSSATAGNYATSGKAMYMESDTATGLLYRVVLHDGAGAANLKDRKVEFNRKAFGAGTQNNNLYDDTMKMRSELPQMEMVSDDKTHFFRFVAGNDGVLYIQHNTATAGSNPSGEWDAANIVSDKIIGNNTAFAGLVP
jgi:hypothetical protein